MPAASLTTCSPCRWLALAILPALLALGCGGSATSTTATNSSTTAADTGTTAKDTAKEHPSITLNDLLAGPNKYDTKSVTFNKVQLIGKLFPSPTGGSPRLSVKDAAGTAITEQGPQGIIFIVGREYSEKLKPQLDEAKTYHVNLTGTVKRGPGRLWQVVVSKVDFLEK